MDYVITVTAEDGHVNVVHSEHVPDGIYVICGDDSFRQKPIYLDRYTLSGDPVRPATKKQVKRG